MSDGTDTAARTMALLLQIQPIPTITLSCNSRQLIDTECREIKSGTESVRKCGIASRPKMLASSNILFCLEVSSDP